MCASHSPERLSGRWLNGGDPEDPDFWARTGKRIAHRNLLLSVLTEHVSFSVWSVWSVLILFMTPRIGFDFSIDEKFLLVCIPTLVGALLRLPYSYGLARFGGRDWTVFSTTVLLVPTGLICFFIQQPGTPLWVFLLLAAMTGMGGGNFASSMTNIAGFFPSKSQGWALGLNAGGGNIGVATVQIVGILVIAHLGDTNPAYVTAIYLPLLVTAALLALWKMDNIDTLRIAPYGWRAITSDLHTWLLSLLYLATFGSFVGFSFAFGLVLQTEFAFSPLQAAGYTFVGPLLGSLSRPVGGWFADIWGGAIITFCSFTAMVAGTGTLLVASTLRSFPLYLAAFTAMFVLTGIGNGSVYKMVPAVFARRSDVRSASAMPVAARSPRTAQQHAGTLMGVVGSLGALGGVLVTLVFRASFGGTLGSGFSAFAVFLVAYLGCAMITGVVYMRGDLRTAGAVHSVANHSSTSEITRV